VPKIAVKHNSKKFEENSLDVCLEYRWIMVLIQNRTKEELVNFGNGADLRLWREKEIWRQKGRE
jgi:hypothetical protein